MKSILIALTLVLALGSTANAEEDFLTWLGIGQQQATVEKHPKADEPVNIKETPPPLMPPYIAQQLLRGNEYFVWALQWNMIQDEVARRGFRERTVYGSTTTRTQTSNGTVTRVTPHFWRFREGVPGEIRYNPFVQPKEQDDFSQ